MALELSGSESRARSAIGSFITVVFGCLTGSGQRIIGDLSLMGLGVRALGAEGSVASFAKDLRLGEARRELVFRPVPLCGMCDRPTSTGEGDVGRRFALSP